MATSQTANSKKSLPKIATKISAKKPPAKKISPPKGPQPAVGIIAKAAPDKKTTPKKTQAKPTVTPEQRYNMIAANAYLRAEQRGFSSGHALDDWVAAEAEVNAMLSANY